MRRCEKDTQAVGIERQRQESGGSETTSAVARYRQEMRRERERLSGRSKRDRRK